VKAKFVVLLGEGEEVKWEEEQERQSGEKWQGMVGWKIEMHEKTATKCNIFGIHCPVSYILAVWLSGNALASINVVALRQTQLVSGWVTVFGRVNHLGM